MNISYSYALSCRKESQNEVISWQWSPRCIYVVAAWAWNYL